MTITILEKGQRTQLDAISIQPKGSNKYYFGMGWDVDNGEADLDLCVALTESGKVKHFVYYDNKSAPGVQLSNDNRTGEGEGDDEWAKIDTAALPSNIDGIEIGVAIYDGPDFKEVANPHIRWCDGDNESSPQMGDFPIKDSAFAGDTVLHVVTLQKTGSGWMLKADGVFHSKGKGSAAINGFKDLFV